MIGLGRWFLRLRRTVRRHLGETVPAVVPEPPDAPASRTLYVVGDHDDLWCAVLACPCGCGEVIRLSLVNGDHPMWGFSLDASDRPTLLPSVHRTVGCRSHFFVRAGQIIWADAALSNVPR